MKHTTTPMLRFESFVNHAATVASGGRAVGADDSSQGGDLEWYGGVTFEDAVKMGLHGWPEGVKRLQSLLPVEGGVETVSQWSLDVAGAFPCVAAYVTGDPECMWQQVQVDGARRRIALCAPLGASHNIKAAARFEYGAALAQVVSELLAANIDVALYSIQNSLHQNDRYTVGVAVREFDEPLDLSRIAFAGHPAFHRRLRFAWTEATAAYVPVASNGYGITAPLIEADVLAIAPDLDREAIRILPTIQHNRNTRAEWVEEFRTIIKTAATE